MHRALSTALALLAASTSLLGKGVEGKLVFAHYLVKSSISHAKFRRARFVSRYLIGCLL